MGSPSRPPDPDAELRETARAFRTWMDRHAGVLEGAGQDVAEDLHEAVSRARPLQQLLWDDGWNRLGWPVAHGGLGGTPLHRFVVAEELSAAGYALPEVLGTVEIIAPMLVKYAPHLAARHLGPSVRGDEVWCQGFSEPEAGSDLGSLRTRAVADGDGFRLHGQKMWSSFGGFADWCCLLARTGDPDSGYRGLTMFWVDLRAPGVVVVPTRCENGRAETAEIFLDDVHVPGGQRIGALGQGWTAVMYLMQYERGAFAWGRQAEHHRQLAGLVRDLTDPDAAVLIPPDADRIIGDAYLSALALRSQARTTVERLAAGEELGPEISVDKLLLSNAEQTIAEAARRLLSPRLELSDDPTAAWWRERWAYSRITTIYGGASEVQRDLVAERLLGLPRGR